MVDLRKKPFYLSDEDIDWVEQTISEMSLEEKIGQLFVILDRKKDKKQIKELFDRYHVGGCRYEHGDAEAIYELNDYFQQVSKIPVLIACNCNSGGDGACSDGTHIATAAACGASGDEKVSYDTGYVSGKESTAIGCNWNFGPVCDILYNWRNTIVNSRAYGNNPDQVLKHCKAYIEGMRKSPIAVCCKHFPGDGVDYRDQHLMTTVNSLSEEMWKQYHGKVFAELIKKGVACIMPGHITLPFYQKEKINGYLPPATLSHELLTGLLKKEMHFNGVVVSDAMTMAGFRGWYKNDLEGQVASFLAGVDILLWPSYEYMDTVEVRIQRGEIPMERLDDAVRRVWAMKERFGLLNKNRELIRPVSAEEKAEIREAAKEITERSITLVRDEDHKLPLSLEKDKKLLLVAVTPVAHKGNDRDFKRLQNLRDEFVKNGFEVDFRRNILYEDQGWQDNATEVYDKVIFLVARNTHTPFGPLQLWDDEAQSVWAANSMDKSKVIVISLGSPYIGNEYFERVKTYINTYSNDASTHSALLRILLGQLPFKGKSPVNLEHKLFTF